MKTAIIISCFIIISISTVGQSSFEISYSTYEDEIMIGGIEDNNGNYILTGGIGDFVDRKYDALAMKITNESSYIARRFAKGDTVSSVSEAVLLDDGNYMVFGSYSPIGDFDARDHFWIIKLDHELNTIFEKTFIINGFYHSCAAGYAIIDNDGNIVMAAKAYYYDPPNTYAYSDMMLVKLGQDGDTLMTSYHHDQYTEFVYEISQIPNSSDYLVLGGAFGLGGALAQYIRIDSTFNIKAIKDFPGINTYGIDFTTEGSSDHWSSDTSFLYSASFSFPSKKEKGESAFGVFNVDTNANILQHQYFDRPDTMDYAAWKNSMAYANDTTIYIGGFQSVMNPWANEPTILEMYVVDKELNLLGYKDYGADANNQLIGIMPTSDGGCLMYATRFDNEQGIPERDIRIIKLQREDIELETSPITATKETLQQVGYKAYPNPATHTINIPIPGQSVETGKRISIFTIEGKKILDRGIPGEGNVLQVDVHSLVPGIYLYQISSPMEKLLKGKFIKE